MSGGRRVSEGVGDALAVLDRDERAVGAVGHDLHGRPFLALDQHAHELIAHAAEGRCDGRCDAGLKPLVLGQFLVVGVVAQKRKKAAR